MCERDIYHRVSNLIIRKRISNSHPSRLSQRPVWKFHWTDLPRLDVWKLLLLCVDALALH